MTPEEAEAYLASLEPIGWRLGLERMRALMGELGAPQRRFDSVHVVGTNGKSSVAAMTAGLLAAHGARSGAYLSPHVGRWHERVLLDGGEIDPCRFAAAVGEVAEAGAAVNASLGGDEAVTQFEVATAAAFVALAGAGVEVAAVEAGLGGRLDATNVADSRVAVLTSIGLEHTEWLGETEEQIAAEKLAVVREGSTLVLGRLSGPVREQAIEHAQRVGASVHEPQELPEGLELSAPGPFQRRNLAVAIAAAEAVLGRALDPGRVREVAARWHPRGRMELLGTDPPTILDAAHNPSGAAALAEALPEASGGRPVVACLAVLEGKDAAGMIRPLAGAIDLAVCTELPSPDLAGLGRSGAASIPAGDLAALAASSQAPEARAVIHPREALRVAREEAGRRGGVVLVAGSHYLLRYANGN